MAMMEISIVPLGTGSTSLSRYVAQVISRLDGAGLAYELTDMGTIIQGDAARLMELAAELHEIPFAHGVKRVYTVIKLDDRRDKPVVLGEKSASVRSKVGDR